MEVESRLNDEVRGIPGQYSDYMRQEDVGCQQRIDNNRARLA